MDRTPLAYVSKTHGAWLIHWVGEWAADRPEDDNFEAARSLKVAKRVAKDGASGIAANLRWVESPDTGGWILVGVENEWGPE